MHQVLPCALLCLLLTNCALLGRLQETADARTCVSHGADFYNDNPAYARCRERAGTARSQQVTPLPLTRPKAPGAGALTIPN
jgi:hypothetical protein